MKLSKKINLCLPLTADELAKAMGTSVDAVRKWVREGWCPYVVNGKSRRYYFKDVSQAQRDKKGVNYAPENVTTFPPAAPGRRFQKRRAVSASTARK